jgi:hypothetical protein
VYAPRQILEGPANRGGQAVQRLFIGLLCFTVLYGLFGCSALKDASSRSGQESSPQQREAQAPPPVPETPQTCPLDSVACVPQATPLAAALKKEGPVAQVPETSFDFGIMNEDKEFVHKFRIRNVGTSELIIKQILPEWGSWVSRYDKAIPPGGEGAITLAVSAKSCAGGARKFALVTCNDPQAPYFYLIIKGQSSL